ncbi:hypothetical protein HDG32_003501 [Paraburkholderia sp. CI2]|uniref:hypothetical protein n=1 Tax=Paraburkholderia sp. CI2 TaxID=2723093 RepID=UPI00161C160D|nr:hypothetical protein [Paraburkholderia sp. CI2]MBB5467378.1 hypothetical protein [Paraburkholderia sp. CI2]
MRQAVVEYQVSFGGRYVAVCASSRELRQSTALQQFVSRSLARQGRGRCLSPADNRSIQTDFVGGRAGQAIFLLLRCTLPRGRFSDFSSVFVAHYPFAIRLVLMLFRGGISQ